MRTRWGATLIAAGSAPSRVSVLRIGVEICDTLSREVRDDNIVPPGWWLMGFMTCDDSRVIFGHRLGAPLPTFSGGEPPRGPGHITESGYYRQLLRLVYRFLFLSAAEERHLLFPPNTLTPEKYNVYRHYYSVSQLRDRAERYFRNDTNSDAWLGLIKTFDILRDENMAEQLGLAALNGELFSRSNCQALENAFCSNENLLSAIRELSTFLDDGKVRRRVNYAGLDVEEFGSVYESLLDYHPRVNMDNWTFSLVAGSERKQTGSYYTPPELVKELIESALVPVIDDRLKGLKTKDDKENALIRFKSVRPSCRFWALPFSCRPSHCP